MAKYINGKVRIIVQDGEITKTFETDGMGISSADGGQTYEATFARIKMVDARVQHDWGTENLPVAPSVPTEAEKAKEVMLAAARDYEKATLDSARQLQKAQEAVNSVQAAAEHRLNQSILAFYHTGNSDMDADKAFEAAGLVGFEDRTTQVADFNTDRLYSVDSGHLNL